MAAVGRLRRAAPPRHGPDFEPLYELAVRDGEALLARRYRNIRPDERRDFVHDVLAKALEAIVEAENPRGMFIVCLSHHVASLFRGAAKQRTEVDELRARAEVGHVEGSAEARVELGELLMLLEQAPPRDVQVLLAAAIGELDTEALAAIFGTSRDNVYKIISRLRLHLRAVKRRKS